MLSSAAVNSLGDMVSPYRTPLLMLIVLLPLCSLRAIGVDFLQEFHTHIFYSVFLKQGQYEYDAEWDNIFSAL